MKVRYTIQTAPAEAGVQFFTALTQARLKDWIPAYAGMVRSY